MPDVKKPTESGKSVSDVNSIETHKSQSPVALDQYSYTITCVKFFGEVWDHSATIFGKQQNVSKENYHSVYPKKEELPSIGDPEDSIANMRIIFFNVKRMTYTDIEHESPDELDKFPHKTVEIPVTKEQFEKAQDLAKREKESAAQGTSKYSIFPTKWISTSTYSCAGHQHNILDTITTSDEKDMLHPMGKIWPTKTFENAKKIAANRKNPTPHPSMQYSDKPSEPGSSEFGFFSTKGLMQSLVNAQDEKRERFGFGKKQ